MHNFSVQDMVNRTYSIKILSLKILITKTNLEWLVNYSRHPEDGNISKASNWTNWLTLNWIRGLSSSWLLVQQYIFSTAKIRNKSINMYAVKIYRMHQEQTIKEKKIQQYFSDPCTIRIYSVKDLMTIPIIVLNNWARLF